MNKAYLLFLAPILSWNFTLGQQSIEKVLLNPEEIKTLIEQGKLSEARLQILKMPRDFQSSAESMELSGDVFGGLKLWDSALVYYEKFKELAPKNAASHFKYGGALGMMALSKNKLTALMYLDDIEASFQKAVLVDPTYVAAHWALIEYYLQVPSIIGGGSDRAMEQADELFKVSPVDGWMARARLAEEDEDFKRAEQNYLKAINVGASLWTYKGIISFYERQERWDSGFEQLNVAMTKFDDLSLNYQWAKMSVLSEKYLNEGISFIEECLGKQEMIQGIPEQWIRLRYAQLLRIKGRYKSAMDQVDIALSLDTRFQQAKDEKATLKKLLK